MTQKIPLEDGPIIAQKRRKGFPLEKIGQEYGVTREGIRRFLRDHYPDSLYPSPDLISISEAKEIVGVSADTFKRMAQKLEIKPEYSSRFITWWSRNLVNKMASRRVCRICGEPLPKRHYAICNNERCRKEAYAYRNRSPEARAAHQKAVSRWQKEHPEAYEEIRRRVWLKRRHKGHA